LAVQAEYQLKVAPVHAFYLRPPFESLLFVPLTFLSYRLAYVAWLFTSIGLLGVAAWLIQANTSVLGAMLQYTHGIPVDFGLLFILFLTFDPVMDCLLIGQDSILLLLIYTFVFVALKRGREFEAGCLLACGLFKFHLVLPFAVIFALRRRFSFVGGFAIVGALLAALSVLLCGPAVLISYPAMFLNSGSRALMGFQPEYAANIRGLIYLVTPASVPSVIPGIAVALLSAFLLWITANEWNDSEFELCFSIAVIASLLTGYHLFVYDLSLLLLPVSIVCGELASRNRLLKNAALNVTLLVLFLQPIHNVLATHHIYAVMCVPVVGLLFGVRKIVSRKVISPCPVVA
jgi:hypothetical protein